MRVATDAEAEAAAAEEGGGGEGAGDEEMGGELKAVGRRAGEPTPPSPATNEVS